MPLTRCTTLAPPTGTYRLWHNAPIQTKADMNTYALNGTPSIRPLYYSNYLTNSYSINRGEMFDFNPSATRTLIFGPPIWGAVTSVNGEVVENNDHFHTLDFQTQLRVSYLSSRYTYLAIGFLSFELGTQLDEQMCIEYDLVSGDFRAFTIDMNTANNYIKLADHGSRTTTSNLTSYLNTTGGTPTLDSDWHTLRLWYKHYYFEDCDYTTVMVRLTWCGVDWITKFSVTGKWFVNEAVIPYLTVDANATPNHIYIPGWTFTREMIADEFDHSAEGEILSDDEYDY